MPVKKSREIEALLKNKRSKQRTPAIHLPKLYFCGAMAKKSCELEALLKKRSKQRTPASPPENKTSVGDYGYPVLALKVYFNTFILRSVFNFFLINAAVCFTVIGFAK